jgi:hypothetical protein
VLGYNEPLAVKLAAMMKAKGLTERVLVRHFHKWCRQQLVAFGQPLPGEHKALAAPRAPYQALCAQLANGRRQVHAGRLLAQAR